MNQGERLEALNAWTIRGSQAAKIAMPGLTGFDRFISLTGLSV